MGVVILFVIICAAVVVVVPAVLLTRTGQSMDFTAGFKQCCPNTASLLNLSSSWTNACLNQRANFQNGFSQKSTLYYDNALLGLGMENAMYQHAMFWSSNMVGNVPAIGEKIGSQGPPSSFNIPAGAFGNCIGNFYKDDQLDFSLYWFEYSRMMAERATGYVFWLTTGDRTRRYFPAVEMGMMERIWGTYELPNLAPPRVPGVVVLNGRSPSSQGLTCNNDTASKDKLVDVNNRLVYFCCDVDLDTTSVLNTINNVLSGM